MQTPLERYDVFEGSKNLGTLWILTKKDVNLQCTISTHRHGWQLHLTKGSKLARTHLCRTDALVFEIADDWKNEALATGWLPSTTSVVELEFLRAEVRVGLAFVSLAAQSRQKRSRAKYRENAMRAYRAATDLRLRLQPGAEACATADDDLAQLREAIAAIPPS